MRKPVLLATLVIVLLVAAITTGTALVARAVANALTTSGSDGSPTAGERSGEDPALGAASSPSRPTHQPSTPSLIVHKLKPGEQLITDAQINDYYLAQSPAVIGDLANTRLIIREGQIEVRCMADKGWWYDPRYRSGLDSNTPEGLALDGNTGAGDAYRWQDAGCQGLAAHETGASN